MKTIQLQTQETVPLLCAVSLQSNIRNSLVRFLKQQIDANHDSSHRLFQSNISSVQDILCDLKNLKDVVTFICKKNQFNFPTISIHSNDLEHWLEQESNHVVVYGDAHYPAALANIADPPLVLFARGVIDVINKPCLAIVGSRQASEQSNELANTFSKSYAQEGWVVVSGLAKGVDANAHSGALCYGYTIAVVGHGLDIVYPKSNYTLSEKIATQGLLVSEYPLHTPPLPHHFPIRNRIIAGLSSVVVVIEAGVKSGSLITARLAQNESREVFAVPGSIHTDRHAGCHQLIRNHYAGLITKPSDIYDTISVPKDIVRKNIIPPSLDANILISDLAKELYVAIPSVTFTDLQLQLTTKLQTDKILAGLIELECAGLITKSLDGDYKKI
ncbi:MAG: DNA-processing protein DprA [Methylacidiphilales bacterium]|nr:DNA-processing protein DprA [Candidatus Methylacidiphilales bacterium]